VLGLLNRNRHAGLAIDASNGKQDWDRIAGRCVVRDLHNYLENPAAKPGTPPACITVASIASPICTETD
jgi:hypothetical protein